MQQDTAQQQRELMRNRGICVVIPTYNNATTIASVVDRSLTQCGDVIVVNDGCTDSTASILRSIGGITTVTLPRNSGKGAALRAGFAKAMELGFSYAITIDADGQHFPEDIPLLVDCNTRHPGALIVGRRRDLDSMERSGGSRFANAFSNFWFFVQTLRPLPDTQSGYRLYPLRRLFGLRLLTSRYEAELELLVLAAWHGVDIVSTPVRVYYPPREERVSHFRPAYDFTRISVLNTVLCCLAVAYALPLALLRAALTLLRTVYSLLFYLLSSTLYLLPATLIALRRHKDRAGRERAIHRLLHRLAHFLMFTHGIPGVRFSVSNPQNEDFSRPAIVVCNHQSSLDIMAMLALSPRLVILTKDWVYRSPFFGLPLRHASFYPVSMGYDALLPLLREQVGRGYSIVVYPEGTRSADGAVQRFHQGAFQMARDLGLDILPVSERGASAVLPRGAKYLRRGFFSMTIHPRITPDQQRSIGSVRQFTKWMRGFYRGL